MNANVGDDEDAANPKVFEPLLAIGFNWISLRVKFGNLQVLDELYPFLIEKFLQPLVQVFSQKQQVAR